MPVRKEELLLRLNEADQTHLLLIERMIDQTLTAQFEPGHPVRINLDSLRQSNRRPSHRVIDKIKQHYSDWHVEVEYSRDQRDEDAYLVFS